METVRTTSACRQAIQAMDEAGAEVIIIDSLSHVWSGEGGVLDIQGQLASRGGNSLNAWRKASPLHHKLVDAVILNQRHIIATLRTVYMHPSHFQGRLKGGRSPCPGQRQGCKYLQRRAGGKQQTNNSVSP